jgi:hypothetical protein
MIPAWSRFCRTMRTNPAGAASGRNGRFECPAYETRASAMPAPKLTSTAPEITTFACVARRRTGANRAPLSPGPTSSIPGATGLGFSRGGLGAGPVRMVGTRAGLRFAIYPIAYPRAALGAEAVLHMRSASPKQVRDG